MGDVSIVQVLIAVAMAYVIWRVSLSVIHMLATPPPEIDPEDIVEIRQDFRCTICGTEVTMTVANQVEDAAPRHCREDMVPV